MGNSSSQPQPTEETGAQSTASAKKYGHPDPGPATESPPLARGPAKIISRAPSRAQTVTDEKISKHRQKTSPYEEESRTEPDSSNSEEDPDRPRQQIVVRGAKKRARQTRHPELLAPHYPHVPEACGETQESSSFVASSEANKMSLPFHSPGAQRAAGVRARPAPASQSPGEPLLPLKRESRKRRRENPLQAESAPYATPSLPSSALQDEANGAGSRRSPEKDGRKRKRSKKNKNNDKLKNGSMWDWQELSHPDSHGNDRAGQEVDVSRGLEATNLEVSKKASRYDIGPLGEEGTPVRRRGREEDSELRNLRKEQKRRKLYSVWQSSNDNSPGGTGKSREPGHNTEERDGLPPSEKHRGRDTVKAHGPIGAAAPDADYPAASSLLATTPKKKRRLPTVGFAEEPPKASTSHAQSNSSAKGLKTNKNVRKVDPSKKSLVTRTGPFDKDELEKVFQFRDRYCQEHDINHVEFNLKVHSNARTNVALKEFWEGMHEELPDRDRTAIQKFCRRKLHNFDKRGKWTTAEDGELKKLHAKYGASWIKIAELMGRMSEDVRDRYRNYIVQGDNRESKKWSSHDIQCLRHAVGDCILRVIRDQTDDASLFSAKFSAAKMAAVADSNYVLNWEVVSRLLGGRRSRLQCSYKFKYLVGQGKTTFKLELMDAWSRHEKQAAEKRRGKQRVQLHSARELSYSGEVSAEEEDADPGSPTNDAVSRAALGAVEMDDGDADSSSEAQGRSKSLETEEEQEGGEDGDEEGEGEDEEDEDEHEEVEDEHEEDADEQEGNDSDDESHDSVLDSAD